MNELGKLCRIVTKGIGERQLELLLLERLSLLLLGYLPHDGSVLGRGDIHLIAPRFSTRLRLRRTSAAVAMGWTRTADATAAFWASLSPRTV